ncbi:Fe-S cluster assembly ATPase SufC [Candidatus Absconditicoccus praedator]|uniref:Fe-S cluster assembly ATPase SufC n=1 Tax=Candidatus Absconditicoccus praedator TaxID=2735562 RepID=UPI001E59B096|nr:Fe-S cluster assembly ATPase SufC [Candidatus Absconditicoccus praedator]
MLKIKNLNAQVEGNNILKNVSIDFEKGKNYAVLGKNGSGKSSLAFCVMGHPHFEITNGEISVDGESLLDMSPEERSQKGIFLAFQNIPEIPGVKLFEFLKLMYNSRFEKKDQLSFMKFKKMLLPLSEELGIDKDMLFRDINVGFSGGEKRKVEMLQLKLLEPRYIMLDEVDSGLDINSLRQLGDMVRSIDSKENSFIIVSHYFDIFEYIDIENVIIMKDGTVSKKGDKSLIDSVKKDGF